MSAPDIPISMLPGFIVSTSDIRINYINTCQIIAAANNVNGGKQWQFYSQDGGQTWSSASLPFVQDDKFHAYPTVDWTSDGTAWAVTLGTPSFTAPTSKHFYRLRAYKWKPAPNMPQSWGFDDTVSGTQLNTVFPKMWVDHSPVSPYRDNIYVIWQNNNSVYVNRRDNVTQTWQTPIQMSQSGFGCDITTNSSGAVFAFWRDSNNLLLVSTSTNGGADWSDANKIAYVYCSDYIVIPSFASRAAPFYISGGAYKNSVYAVWIDLNDNASALGCDKSGPGTTNVLSPCTTRIWFHVLFLVFLSGRSQR